MLSIKNGYSLCPPNIFNGLSPHKDRKKRSKGEFLFTHSRLEKHYLKEMVRIATLTCMKDLCNFPTTLLIFYEAAMYRIIMIISHVQRRQHLALNSKRSSYVCITFFVTAHSQ